jgi:hypothetical protein
MAAAPEFERAPRAIGERTGVRLENGAVVLVEVRWQAGCSVVSGVISGSTATIAPWRVQSVSVSAGAVALAAQHAQLVRM